jgi:hypothetical protein
MNKLITILTILITLVTTFIIIITNDLSFTVSALSFERVNIQNLDVTTINYENAIQMVKSHSNLIPLIRTNENIQLENEIYKVFSGDDYILILKKRILFMAEYIKHYNEYYKYISQETYNQAGSSMQKARLINTLLNEFYLTWQNEYNIFLKKILLKEL